MRREDLINEIIVRIVLLLIFELTEDLAPFHRVLQREEMWLYRYPQTDSYYPGILLWVTVYSVPILVFGLFYHIRRDIEDFVQAMLSASMSLYMTGIFTNTLKMCVGRPRPDFLARCFPDGVPAVVELKSTLSCPGDEWTVLDGLKSFPSNHSAFTFSTLGFVSMYVAGKLRVFNRGRGHGLRFLAFVAPLVWAVFIAVSRTCDYHHHWEDIMAGSMIGLLVAYFCYRQAYPCLGNVNSHICHSYVSSTEWED